MDVPSE